MQMMESDNSAAGEAGSIQAIDKKSVHRICSGQVVLNLATAVKELVENSVDAGATYIDVRLKDYGSTSIEVIDNGSGVEEKNFEGLTLKHHTSKLKDFSDLVNVETFGFRGEALSSLCALGNMTITTCHKDANVGTKLEFDHNGKITCKTSCARQKGTTVMVQNIFTTLPVRYGEFQRNLKKEFNKMVHVLNAYCIITTGVKITCTNQIEKGKKNLVVNKNDNASIKENVMNIFGAKQVKNLLEFQQFTPSEEACAEYGLKYQEKSLYRIMGYVSSSEHGEGRNTTDRQFFFVNNRPCDLTKVSRVVNEVYHIYNRHKYPFVVLNISIEKESLDVNVTPDKRTIFITEEKLLLAIIKTSLTKMFEPKSSLYQVNNIPRQLQKFSRKEDEPQIPLEKHTSCPLPVLQKSKAVTLSNLKRSFSSAFSEESPTKKSFKKSPVKVRSIDSYMMFKSTKKSVSKESEDVNSSTRSISGEETKAVTETQNTEPNTKCEVLFHTVHNNESDKKCEVTFHTMQNRHVEEIEPDNFPITKCEIEENPGKESECAPRKDNELHQSNIDIIMHSPNKCDNSKSKRFQNPESSNSSVQETDEHTASSRAKETISGFKVELAEIDHVEKIERRECKIPFNLQKIKDRISARQKSSANRKTEARSFRATITPGDNQAAEDELKKEISKDMFSKMKILGQFNLGFIIAQFGEDLFIIDQHATDEKYNFEMLQKHTVIQSQKLIQPQSLELTAPNEGVLIDNLSIFEKNGFHFLIDEDGEPTKRIKLVSAPVSKNWTFGKDDIEELIFMLSDSPGVQCRPSRIRAMFASRSCRKSVMIGTALKKAEMKKLVCHMGEIEQPWNCPHGRPTMRHLINLGMIPD